MKRFVSLFALLLLAATAAESATAEELAPSFRGEVMPVFFRAGCNSGTCHGSARGKDGFMLSLFGYDPQGDYERIVTDMIGRRVNVAVPERSLLLLKATGAVSHTGGKRFDRDSDYYKTLLRWIEAGAPDDVGSVPEIVGISIPKDSVVIKTIGAGGVARVTAHVSDGSSRDVTKLARFFSNNPSVATIDADGKVTSVGPGDTNVFAQFNRFTVGVEVIVLPTADGFVWTNPPPNNFIDEIVFDRLEKLRITPSDLCDDETFLRRVTLDLAARPPTVDEYHAFMADAASDKRAKKIDELLAADAFADFWTALWAEQLRVIGGESGGGTHKKAADQFVRWIKSQLRSGRPLNEFVAEMVAASGSVNRSGPPSLYTQLVHDININPKALASDFSRVFLGVQIQCAECHNHPFDRWTMDDYYGFVSFFTGIRRKNGLEANDKVIYFDASAEPAKHLVDGRPMPAKVLGAIEPVGGEGDPRKALADWLTSPDNELFSRNLANRIWAQLLGSGVIEPVDDIRVSNPPVNPALLDALAKRLVDAKFDLRALVRDICNSRVYQLSVQPTESNARDTRQFSHAHLRRLRADVLLDSLADVSGMPPWDLHGWPTDTRAINVYPRVSGGTGGGANYENNSDSNSFFKRFGASTRATVCACETKTEPTLAQTLHMAVGNIVSGRLSRGGVVTKLIETKSTPEEIIDELFIRTLGRRPTNDEMTATRELVGDNVKDPAVYEDLFWSLLNATEFAFNH
ncbi:MAG: DUF1549 domain-containing protein [Planctomycetota bacterium]